MYDLRRFTLTPTGEITESHIPAPHELLPMETQLDPGPAEGEAQ